MKKINNSVDVLGNSALMNLSKTVFLCSDKYSSKSVLLSYDWAKEQREKGRCIISGFHSPLEKDVLEILLKGPQPIIYVLARGLFKTVPAELKPHIEAGRLLIAAPFEKEVTRITKKNAEVCNRLCISLAEQIVVAHLEKGGQIENILFDFINRSVDILDK